MQKQIAIALLLISFLFTSDLGAPLQAEPLRVGVILPLSGEFAPIGKAIEKGIRLRLDQRDAAQLEFLVEDDKTFERAQVVSIYQKFRNIDRVSLVFATVAPVVEPLAPLLRRQQGPPVIAMWDRNEHFVDSAHGLFSTGFSNEQAGIDLAEFAYVQQGLSHVALIGAHDEWSEIVSDAFVKRFRELGGTIDLHEIVDLGTEDFRGLIARIRSKAVPGVVFPLYGPSLGALIRQLREQRYSGLLLTGEGLLPADRRALGESAQGIFYQRIPSSRGGSLPAQDSSEAQSLTGFEAMGSDMVSLAIALSARLSPSCTWAEVASTLGELNFHGLLGRVDFARPELFKKSLELLRVEEDSHSKAAPAF